MDATGSQGLIGLITRLSKAIHRLSTEDMLGMSLRGFVVLGYVQSRGGTATQQEIGDALCLDANSVVLLLHELEDASFVVRQRDPADRRRHIISVTSAGEAAFARAEEGREGIEDQLLAALSPEERAQLRDLIAKALEGVVAPA